MADLSLLKGAGFILLAAFCWSLIGPFSLLIMLDDITPLEISFWRCSLSASLLLCIALFSKQKPAYTKADIPLIFGWAVFGVALSFVAYPKAVYLLGNGLASILLYTAPLWIMLISIGLYKNTPSFRQIIALSIGLLGIVFICWPSQIAHLSYIAVIWGVLSGLGYGLQYFFNNSRLQKHALLWNLSLVWLIASLLIAPWVHFAPKSAFVWFNLIGLSFISTLLAFTFWSLSLRYLSPLVVAVIALLEPLLAVLWGILFFNERLSLLGYMGAAFILLAALMMIFASTKRQEKQ